MHLFNKVITMNNKFLRQQMNVSLIEGGWLPAEKAIDEIFHSSIISKPLLSKRMLHRPVKVEIRRLNLGE